jgi:hypothetical protein
MKQAIRFFSVAALVFSVSLSSCKKDPVTQESATKKALMAHTWQMETVINYSSGTPVISYQRGGTNNQDDFSMVRQTYKSNGSITYVDSFGESGSDGTYELLDNDAKIKIGGGASGFSLIGENLKVTASEFAYTLNFGDGDSTRFVFSPFH